jgi:hypothetical protein
MTFGLKPFGLGDNSLFILCESTKCQLAKCFSIKLYGIFFKHLNIKQNAKPILAKEYFLIKLALDSFDKHISGKKNIFILKFIQILLN